MSTNTDQPQRDRQARLLSHAARKYSRQLRRVTRYLEAHDRLATPAPTSASPNPSATRAAASRREAPSLVADGARAPYQSRFSTAAGRRQQ
jgi:hypothetical protein